MERTIVNTIKTLCDDNNISIGDLERKLEFSQGLISRWDKNSPSIDKMVSVADFFQVSIDYLLGRSEIKQSTKLEDCFIEKLISETKNYNLNWKEYSQQFIDKLKLQTIFSDLYYIFDDDKVLGEIEFAYELEYNSSCIYLICAEYEYEFSVFLIMQINKNNREIKDNFVPISTYLDLSDTKSLEHEVSLYLKTNKIKDKSRKIMRNFINNAISNLPDEPIPYSHIVNNCLTNMPGFVLDARQGKFLMDEIIKIRSEIDEEKLNK
jgi:transcriptional regulator with XRE-family HTH domain